MQAPAGGLNIYPTHSQPSNRRRWVVSAMLRPLYPRKIHSTLRRWGCVGLGAVLDGTESVSPTGTRSPDRWHHSQPLSQPYWPDGHPKLKMPSRPPTSSLWELGFNIYLVKQALGSGLQDRLFTPENVRSLKLSAYTASLSNLRGIYEESIKLMALYAKTGEPSLNLV
jgi:hypothetical protein